MKLGLETGPGSPTKRFGQEAGKEKELGSMAGQKTEGGGSGIRLSEKGKPKNHPEQTMRWKMPWGNGRSGTQRKKKARRCVRGKSSLLRTQRTGNGLGKGAFCVGDRQARGERRHKGHHHLVSKSKKTAKKKELTRKKEKEKGI